MEYLGVAPGPVVGEALDFLLEARLDEGPIERGRGLLAASASGRSNARRSTRAGDERAERPSRRQAPSVRARQMMVGRARAPEPAADSRARRVRASARAGCRRGSPARWRSVKTSRHAAHVHDAGRCTPDRTTVERGVRRPRRRRRRTATSGARRRTRRARSVAAPARPGGTGGAASSTSATAYALNTRSIESARRNARSARSPRCQSTCTSAPSERSRASARRSSSVSIPITTAPWCASATAAAPVPHPRSSTRLPLMSPMSRSSRSVGPSGP